MTIAIDNVVRYKKRKLTDEEEEENDILDDEDKFHELVIHPPAKVFNYQESTSSERNTPSGSSFGPQPRVPKYKLSNSSVRITPSASSTSVPYETTPLPEADPYSQWSI